MPTKPLGLCRIPGCPHRPERGESYCDKCARRLAKADDQRRGTAQERGYTNRWHKARTTYLRSHPLCVICLKDNRPVPATVVDHIIPHKGNRELFWDESNWQPLCRACHDRKTATEDGAFGNRRRKGEIKRRMEEAEVVLQEVL